MKRVLSLFAACLVAACIPMPVESDISACPADGLQGVTFTAGKPPGGTPIPSQPGQNGETLWDFSAAGDDFIYMQCTYEGGFTRVQQLYNQTKSCRQKPGGALSCKTYL